MNALRSLQQDFLGHLLDESHESIVGQIASNQQCSARERLHLYANAYALRLKEALLTDYERLHAYLGDEQFDHLMDMYIKQYPSHQTSLRYYGQYMVQLLERQTPFSDFPELAELALIEQVFANSFDAANSAPVTLDELQALATEDWAGLTLHFQDAVQFVPLRYNSFQIWRALVHEETPPSKISEESTWLVWRRDLVSRYRGLEDAELAALNAAMSGACFAEICASLLTYYDETETPVRAVGYLKTWIQDQLLRKLETHA